MHAPPPLSRFAIFFLLGALALILGMLGFLKHLPPPPKGKRAATAQPQAGPRP